MMTHGVQKHNAGVRSITVAEWMTREAAGQTFDAILDARSPSEFAEDTLPTAFSTPVLSDAEREQVGTLDKQVSSFEAKRVGAGLVSANIGAMLTQPLFQQPRTWSPLVYCWRGGNRSGALAHILYKIGWQAYQLEGGYKAYRNWVIAELETLPLKFNFHVISGKTGSGKSVLLNALAEYGAQVLDLEALACHKGSILGAYPNMPQPSQKHFENIVLQTLRGFDSNKPVFVEAESAKIGALRVPPALLACMRAAPVTTIEMPMQGRVAHLMQDYAYFTNDPAPLILQLQKLRDLQGATRVDAWCSLAESGQTEALVQALLEQHYDPAYLKSMGRNYQNAHVNIPVLEILSTSEVDMLKAILSF